MTITDRLASLAVVISDLNAQKSQLEHALTQERKRAEDAESEVSRLAAENAVLRGEPNG